MVLLLLSTAVVKGNTREDLLNALKELAKIDLDFNGENGEDYLWSTAKESGYKSNMDYLINDIKDIKEDKELIKEYIRRWIEEDTYYGQSEFSIIENKPGNIIAIALSVVS